ncbi:MAG: hypothetical protein PSN46_05350 [Gammaproteobacteria bacterium]|nr:hypothetical protein [Gammaproteobacteria bacterium]
MFNQSIKALSLVLGLLFVSACSMPATTIPTTDGNTLAGDSPVVANSYADIPISANDQLAVDQSLLLNTGEQWIGRAVLKSKLDTVQAFEYYLDNMTNHGWINITSVQSQISVLTYEKGRRVATIQIEKGTLRGSKISVTVSPRDAIPQ